MGIQQYIFTNLHIYIRSTSFWKTFNRPPNDEAEGGLGRMDRLVLSETKSSLESSSLVIGQRPVS